MNFQVWDAFHVSRDVWRKIITLRVSLTIIKEFALSRKCHQAKQTELKKASRGKKDKAAVAITDEEVDILHETIICLEFLPLNLFWMILFGSKTPFILECVVCCQEQRDLYWRDVKLCKNAQGNEHIVYNERQAKTKSGVDASNFRKVFRKCFQSVMSEILW